MWDYEIDDYRGRAAAEVAMAEQASDAHMVAAHYRLSELYFDLAQAFLEAAALNRSERRT